MNTYNGIIQKIDLEILMNINKYMQNPFMDKVMIFITKLGDNGIVWIVMALFLLLSKKYKKEGVIVLIALLLATILGEWIIKNLVGRVRPFEYIEDVKLLIPKPSSYSFPSGHTASSFAAAVVLGYTFKKYSYIFYILASLIAFSRLYLLVHNPSDIVAGIVLGVSCGVLSIWGFKTIILRKNKQLGNE